MELCEVCQQNEWKYKCPRCLKRTCSVVCSKKHKEADSCSGISSVTEYISSESLKGADTEEEMNHLVQRDYNFLIGMNRKLSILKEDGKNKNKRALQKVPAAAAQTQAGNTYQVTKPHKVLRRGVKCLLLPKGMQRSLSNKSKWDKPLDTFVWSLEWILVDTRENVGANNISWKHLSHRNKEESKLVECLGKQVYDKCKEFYCKETTVTDQEAATTKDDRSNHILNMGLRFFTKWFPNNVESIMDTKEVIEIDPRQCVGEIFKDRTVIEFPTIYIAPNLGSLTKLELNLHVEGQEKSLPVMSRYNNSTKPASDNRVPALHSKSESSSESDPSSSSSSSSDSSSSSESDADSDSSTPEENSTANPAGTAHDSNSDSDSSSEKEDEDGYEVGVSLDFLAS